VASSAVCATGCWPSCPWPWPAPRRRGASGGRSAGIAASAGHVPPGSGARADRAAAFPSRAPPPAAGVVATESTTVARPLAVRPARANASASAMAVAPGRVRPMAVRPGVAAACPAPKVPAAALRRPLWWARPAPARPNARMASTARSSCRAGKRASASAERPRCRQRRCDRPIDPARAPQPGRHPRFHRLYGHAEPRHRLRSYETRIMPTGMARRERHSPSPCAQGRVPAQRVAGRGVREVAATPRAAPAPGAAAGNFANTPHP
jgi:hypothetical protein